MIPVEEEGGDDGGDVNDDDDDDDEVGNILSLCSLSKEI